MNFTFLALACLFCWTSAWPFKHSEDAALERRVLDPLSSGSKLYPEADGIGNSGKPGNNDGTPTNPSVESVEIVNKFFEFLHNASDLVNDEGTEKECNNLSLGSAAKQDCQACKDAINTLSGCTNGKGEIRKNCVCQKILGIPQAVFSANVEKCKTVGSLTAACGAAKQGN